MRVELLLRNSNTIQLGLAYMWAKDGLGLFIFYYM